MDAMESSRQASVQDTCDGIIYEMESRRMTHSWKHSLDSRLPEHWTLSLLELCLATSVHTLCLHGGVAVERKGGGGQTINVQITTNIFIQ